MQNRFANGLRMGVRVKTNPTWAKGFTLLEVTMTMLLSGVVTLGLFAVFGQINKAKSRVEERLVQSGINAVGNLELTKLFLEADGFNYQGEGPCDSTALDFWEHNPQRPGCTVKDSDGKVAADCTRLKSLKVATGRSESDSFIMAINARSLPTGKPAMTLASPPEFYTAGSVLVNGVADFYVSGSLNFDVSKFSKFLKAVGLYFDGAVLRLMSPYPGRVLAADGLYNENIPPRLPSVTITISGGNHVEDRPSWLQCQRLVDYSPAIDLDSAGLGFGKVDTFFRLIPARAGRESPAIIKALRVVKFHLRRVAQVGRNVDSLVVSTWSPAKCGSAPECKDDTGGGSFRSPRVLADNVAEFKVTRSDIRLRSVGFEVVEKYLAK